jgi:biotin-(acetyl-CoA carboxylase) ligase
VSLHTLVEQAPAAEDLLIRWSDALGPRIATLERGGIGAILGDWRRCAVGLGEAVSVAGPAGVVDGVAVDVGEDGALLVQASGQTHRFLAGDVHLTTRAG